MRLSRLIPFAFLSAGSLSLCAGDWKVEETTPPGLARGEHAAFQRLSVRRQGENGFFSRRSLSLVWFDGRRSRLRIIDNGDEVEPRYPTLAEAMRVHGCFAGCNGGFFLENFAPSGLMVSEAKATGRWGSAKLLSGALLVDSSGSLRIIRRSEYQGGAIELIQAGPFLIDRGQTVAGLSTKNARRRTFVLHDGGHRYALGTSDSFTLDDLSRILVEAFGPRTIERALNLDGGTSSGFYYNPGTGVDGVRIEPFKRVRNFVGIVPVP